MRHFGHLLSHSWLLLLKEAEIVPHSEVHLEMDFKIKSSFKEIVRQIVQKLLVTINCMQVTVLLEAAVVFILLATDVTGVTKATCT